MITLRQCAALAVLFVGSDGGSAYPAAGGPTPDRERRPLAELSGVFVPNVGQWQHPARFVARFGAMTLFLEQGGWWIDLACTGDANGGADPRPALRGAALRMSFSGGGPATLTGSQPLPGCCNYFLCSDPSRWRVGVPRFGEVRYRGLFAGVGLRAYGCDGHFEYDLELAPGADLDGIKVRVEGADGLRLDGDGTLCIATSVGLVRQPPPRTYAVAADGTKLAVACRYELRGADRFGFSAPGWDGGSALIVDPGLLYSTFLGGWYADRAFAVAVDASGVATIAGETAPARFPVTPGAWTTVSGHLDAFVARLDPRLPASLQLLYATYFGGSGNDLAAAVAAEGGVITIAGSTASADFPVTASAFDGLFGGGRDGFLLRLDPTQPTARQLVYATFLGGADQDDIAELSVDAAGVATMTGWTGSADFPATPGAWDGTFNGGGDAFVARLDPRLPPAQQLLYSTFFGGTDWDAADALAVDGAGVVTIAGQTWSTNLPVSSGAWDPTGNGADDAFVARLDPRASGAGQLVYSTFLGGSIADRAHELAQDTAGVVTVVGQTGSPDFPTTAGAWDTTHNGGTGMQDTFVVRLDPRLPALQQLTYATFLGGSMGDMARAVQLDGAGVVTLAGSTSSPDFPTTPGAADNTLGGGSDAFVARLDPVLPGPRQLVYATCLGGSQLDEAAALASGADGIATVVGRTAATDFPVTSGAWDTSHNGSWDAFVTRLDVLPAGVRGFGASSPGCAGPLAISVTSMPRIGDATFTITGSGAPPSTTGAMLLAARGLATPLRLLGVDLWLDPAAAWFVASAATSNAAGGAYHPLPLPRNASLVNRQLAAQFAWPGPNAPPPCPPLGWSASSALEITIQP